MHIGGLQTRNSHDSSTAPTSSPHCNRHGCNPSRRVYAVRCRAKARTPRAIPASRRHSTAVRFSDDRLGSVGPFRENGDSASAAPRKQQQRSIRVETLHASEFREAGSAGLLGRSEFENHKPNSGERSAARCVQRSSFAFPKQRIRCRRLVAVIQPCKPGDCRRIKSLSPSMSVFEAWSLGFVWNLDLGIWSF